MTRYEDVLDSLRTAYDGGASARDAGAKDPWKLAEREAFAQRLRAEERTRLLELGAGTGQDSVYFRDEGFDVVATDLSPEMIARCRTKGLDAHVMDFMHLDFPDATFDAAYALNCLLHVPNGDLPGVLQSIRRVLRPSALFFLGAYAGDGSEGPAATDMHVPPRFFSNRTDEQIQGFVRPLFEIVDFHHVPLRDLHFQSLTLRVPS